MSKSKKLSNEGFELIKKWEGEKLKVYKDVANLLTVGIGHLILKTDSLRWGDTISKEYSRELFNQDIIHTESFVNRFVHVDINQNQFDALVSLGFNIGINNFKRSSVLRLLNQGKYEASANAFHAWCKARVGGRHGRLTKIKGLVNRRADEAKFFLKKASKTKKSETSKKEEK